MDTTAPKLTGAAELNDLFDLSDSETQLLANWWERERQPEESMIDFLIRQKAFAPTVGRLLKLVIKGTVQARKGDGLLSNDARHDLLARLANVSPNGHTLPTSDTAQLLGSRAESTTVMQAPREYREGDVVGSYILDQRQRPCQLGVIFHAHHQTTKLRVNLKIISGKLLGDIPETIEHVQQRCERAILVDSPYCLRLFDAGADRGNIFLATEIIEGKSLKELFAASGPLSLHSATSWATQITRGLLALNRAGFSSVYLNADCVLIDGNNRARINDNSFVWAVCHEPTQNQPDQHQLQREDVHQLAGLYYWMLTGEPLPLAVTSAPNLWTENDLDPDLPLAVVEFFQKVFPHHGQGISNAATLLDTLITIDESLQVTLTPNTMASNLSMESAANPSPLARIGTKLGKCVLIELIGQGGFATIFRAQHQSLNIPVAIKVLRPELVARDLNALAQFKQEAQLVAQVSHANVVRVLDFEDDPTQPYLVMEFVEGMSLWHLVRQSGKLRPDRAVELVRQIAEGLHAAYKLAVVHRDVSPANVLLTRDGCAKVTDFGLAMIAGQSERHRNGNVMGTAAYMSPEQIQHGKVDFYSDIYALGATLYQCLSGQVPFAGYTATEVLIKHVTEKPVPLHEIIKGIDTQLSRIVLKMMEKAPEDRYSSYGALISDLSRWQSKNTCSDDQQPLLGSKLWSIWNMLRVNKGN